MGISSLASLLLSETKEAIYSGALSIATTLGLPVTSWQPGDPTRSQLFVESEFLESFGTIVDGFVQSAFLDYASQPLPDGSVNPWLAIVAKQTFNVDVPGATYAETDVLLTNPTGSFHDIEPTDVTFKSSTTGKTYHNTTGGSLAGSGGTLTVTVIADEPGAASSAAATEIDTIVSGPLGVTCSNPAAAVGLDAQAPATTVQQCRDKQGSLSPNGPASAYSFVARNSALTGIQTITRVRVFPNSETGDVTIYVAGASGSVSGGDVTAVQNAINTWAAPLCITPTVASASNVTVAVSYTLWVYKSVNQTTAQIQAAIQTALEALFAARPIGGDIIPPATTGALYVSLIESTIRGVIPAQAFRVSVTAPGGDTALTNGQVPVLGVVTPTINIVTDPQ